MKRIEQSFALILLAFEGEEIEQALFVSPLLDMKTFIECMVQRDEAYYEWVVNHPMTKWRAETYILRPAVDLVVNENVYQSFLSSHNCQVEIVDCGEQWKKNRSTVATQQSSAQ